MSDTLFRVRALVGRDEILISAHGYDELDADGILVSEVLDGLVAAVVVEDYPDAVRGPTVLVLQRGLAGQFMWFGGSRRDDPDPPSWSRRTGLIPTDGPMTS